MAGNKDNNHTKRRKGGSTISSSSHIRFGQEEDCNADAKPVVSNEQKSPTQEGAPATSTSTTSASTSSSDNQHQKKNKRKRKHTSSSKDKNEEEDNTKDTSSLSSCNKIFNGLIIAISTLESKKNNTTTTTATTTTNNNAKEGNDDDLYQNYKSLKHHLQNNLGATISPQVHKRVHYLISTKCAIQNLTQRVRQAYKRNVDIVDVAWVKDCIQQKKRVDIVNNDNDNDKKYLCNELVQCLMEEKEREKKERSAVVISKKSAATTEEKEGKVSNIDHGNHSDSDDVVPEEDNEGWSTPIQLDCCCVCHENGDLKCPWCTGKGNECNLTLARIANNVCLPVKS